ncbi:head-tail adaptor protein [Georhizobium profundi]|uniref:Head-tail adaptor protein n=2 Tax=Georhizobium profundi TaxID=2341112 RepID=A0A3S9B777_9HYPH|nr:head-tail adaptor protein [Georhizobium profundi]
MQAMPSNSISAGDLKHRVAFDKRAQVHDGFGNKQAAFQEEFSCRAAFSHRGGSEAVMAARLEGRHVLGVYVRSSENTRHIGSDWRMRDVRTGVVYAIDVVDAVTDRQWVYLTVESGSPA